MKFLIFLTLCIAAAQAGLIASPVATYAVTYSAAAPLAYSAPAYSTYAASAFPAYTAYSAYSAPAYAAPVSTYAAGTAFAAPITTYAAPAVVSSILKKK
ncbi:cuticle protein 16.5 [Drosophila erecta]|uniref:GG17055 n=1 Tax=Drosophila erecta TaxID=7220 RepID=B3P144_DROER|nr:cuticle protein 16.5 [Drosophila erecta]EDV49233.1 uncharacterized protein Dere_GG17055 [Drosophila erecta]